LSAKYNLVADQATTFNFQFVIKNDSTPWNLTGYAITMTIRPFVGANTTTLVVTNTSGEIVIDALNGRVTVTLSATQTDITPQRYAYDMVFDSGSVITRILEGKFIVTPGVTV
jgi:hypothetical protein